MRVTLLVSARELEQDGIQLEGDRYHHLFHARRAKPEVALRLTDGRGRERQVRVDQISSSTATLVASTPVRQVAERPWSALVVPLLKARRTSWMVEKATELNVTELRFYTGPRAPRSLNAASKARFERVAASALSQCHGSWLPILHPTEPLEAVITGLPRGPSRFVCTRGAPAPEGDAPEAVWAIGPEGGFSDRESLLLEGAGFVAVGFGPNVLRAETAAVAALVCGALH